MRSVRTDDGRQSNPRMGRSGQFAAVLSSGAVLVATLGLAAGPVSAREVRPSPWLERAEFRPERLEFAEPVVMASIDEWTDVLVDQLESDGWETELAVEVVELAGPVLSDISDVVAGWQVERSAPSVDQRYVSAYSNAVRSAYSIWRIHTRIEGARIFGPMAVGGSLENDRSLAWLIRLLGPRGDKREAAMTSRLAAEMEASFDAAVDSFHLPGLPLYPAFAAYPGPRAEPMPNVVHPLGPALPALWNVVDVSFGSAGPDGPTLDMARITASIGLMSALGATSISNAMGTGPVPTFAPPYVPVGPVVNGRILPTPGVLS